MLTEKDAQTLMIKLIELRTQVQDTQNDKATNQSLVSQLKKHEAKCINAFQYLIHMKTGRYKQFFNYDDLNQEGFEALMRAMKTYDPAKGSFFSWAHKYIATRIFRQASQHSAIRFPMKFSRETPPHKESKMPAMLDTIHVPETQYEQAELYHLVNEGFEKLEGKEKEVIDLVFGITSDSLPTKNICNQLNISKKDLRNTLKTALHKLQDNFIS